MTIVFAGRVMDAFTERIEAGPLPVERLPFESRAFVHGVLGRRCYWLAHGGWTESAIVGADVFEAPRDQLAYDVYDLEPVNEDRLVSMAVDGLWEDHQLRMAALAASARVQGVEAGPDNTRLFVFGGLLSKSWTEDHRRYESGRLDFGAVVRGKGLLPVPAPT